MAYASGTWPMTSPRRWCSPRPESRMRRKVPVRFGRGRLVIRINPDTDPAAYFILVRTDHVPRPAGAGPVQAAGGVRAAAPASTGELRFRGGGQYRRQGAALVFGSPPVWKHS